MTWRGGVLLNSALASSPNPPAWYVLEDGVGAWVGWGVGDLCRAMAPRRTRPATKAEVKLAITTEEYEALIAQTSQVGASALSIGPRARRTHD